MAACLAAGTALTVAVAWAVALLGEAVPHYTDLCHDVGRQLMWVGAQTATSQSVRLECPKPWFSSLTTAQMAYELATFPTPLSGPMRKQTLPSWAQVSRLHVTPQQGIVHDYCGDRAFGWPMLCLSYGWVHQRASRAFEEDGALRLGSRVVPVRLMPLRFLADVGFWAATILAAIGSILVVRQRFRKARGLCVRCGYDLRFDLAGGCPECAWRRAPVP